ncbi:MAG: hypothetical protein EPO11_04795 [Gammaproteobacteria bacterium]|nr:MAG: hypothetical protein EPO11_04795 [Gammaproteobacteria bacterium]
MFVKPKMRFLSIIFSIFLIPTTFGATAPFTPNELAIIQQYLFANITTDSHPIIKIEENHTIHSIPGAVLASPSNQGAHFSQDYQFHWTRDAAITMNHVAYLYAHASPQEKQQLRPYLINYIHFEQIAQQQISKPGEQTLGQPKYNIDGSIWEGAWMRPQNDGPALRAITMITIANLWMEEDEHYVQQSLLPIITTDINYVTSQWKNTSYDLWEEVNDREHFFNKMVQRKALVDAAALFKKLGNEQQADAYLQTAQKITQSLLKHWNAHLGYLTETVNQQYFKGGGMNTSIILGVLYGDLNDTNDPFAINSDKVLSSVYFIRNAFSGLYQINIAHSQNPPMVGRYPNDIYDGDRFLYGNPWILTTNALAQYYYSLAHFYLKQGKININHENRLFFEQMNLPFARTAKSITVKDNKAQFDAIIDHLIRTGDTLLQTVKKYSVCYSDHTCYHLAEQIDRTSGKQTSAKDLTWGYTSLLSAMETRLGTVTSPTQNPTGNLPH